MIQEPIVVYVDEELEELIPEFLENRHEDATAIINFLGKGDLSEIQRLGHSMRGSGGGYGFFKLTEIGSAIEEAAKIGNIKVINDAVANLRDYLACVKIVYKETH